MYILGIIVLTLQRFKNQVFRAFLHKHIMSLVISISGIRGTIGGKPAEGLTPIDTVQFASAYASWLIQESGKEQGAVVLGRDARISGPMVEQLVSDLHVPLCHAR